MNVELASTIAAGIVLGAVGLAFLWVVLQVVVAFAVGVLDAVNEWRWRRRWLRVTRGFERD